MRGRIIGVACPLGKKHLGAGRGVLPAVQCRFLPASPAAPAKTGGGSGAVAALRAAHLEMRPASRRGFPLGRNESGLSATSRRCGRKPQGAWSVRVSTTKRAAVQFSSREVDDKQIGKEGQSEMLSTTDFLARTFHMMRSSVPLGHHAAISY